MESEDGPSDVVDDIASAQKTKTEFWQEESDCNIQAWWLLCGVGEVTEEAFTCPSDDETVALERGEKGEEDYEGKYGFTDWRNVSYGLQLTTRHEDNDAYLSQRMAPDVIIAGDRAQYEDQGSEARPKDNKFSANHPRHGGNYLLIGSTVKKYQERKYTFGAEGNDVYFVDVPEEWEEEPEDEDTEEVGFLKDDEREVKLPIYHQIDTFLHYFIED
jgi:hypothetical protein